MLSNLAMKKRNTGRGGGRKPKEIVEGEEVSIEEMTRRELRRERNKEAAARCRKRRMDQDSCLQEQVDELLTKRAALEDEMNELKDEEENLKSRLIHHECKRPQRSSVIQITSAPEKSIARTPVILEKVALPLMAEMNTGITLENGNDQEKEEIEMPPSNSNPGITVNELIEASKGFKNSFAGKSKANNTKENQFQPTSLPGISLNDVIEASKGFKNSFTEKSKPTNKENEIQSFPTNLSMHSSRRPSVENQTQNPIIKLTTPSSSGVSVNRLIESTKTFKNSFSKTLPKLDAKPAVYSIPVSNAIGPINIVSPITSFQNQSTILVNARVGEKGSKGVVLQQLIPVQIPTSSPLIVNPTFASSLLPSTLTPTSAPIIVNQTLPSTNLSSEKSPKTLVPKQGMAAKGCKPEITVKQLIDSVKGFKNSFAKASPDQPEQVQSEEVEVSNHIPESHVPTVLYTEPIVQEDHATEKNIESDVSAQEIIESEKATGSTFAPQQIGVSRRILPFKGITKVKPTNIVYPSIPDPILGDSVNVQVRPTEVTLKQLIETSRTFKNSFLVESPSTSAVEENQQTSHISNVEATTESINLEIPGTPSSDGVDYSCPHCEFKTTREDYFKMHIPCAQSLDLRLSNDDDEGDDLVIDDGTEARREFGNEIRYSGNQDNGDTIDIIKKIKPLVQYKCNSCVSIFNKKIDLKTHIEKNHLEHGTQDELGKRERGRPTRKSPAPITPKIPRKNAKFLDKAELARVRRQRKIDLNREASKRFRKNKRLKSKVLEIEEASLEVVNKSLKTQIELIESDITKLRAWIESRGLKAEFNGETFIDSPKKLEKSKKVCLAKKSVRDLVIHGHPNTISIKEETISKTQTQPSSESPMTSNTITTIPDTATPSPTKVIPAIPISILPDPSIARSPLTGSRRVIAIIPGPLLTSKRQKTGASTIIQSSTQQSISPSAPQKLLQIPINSPTAPQQPPTPPQTLTTHSPVNRKQLVVKDSYNQASIQASNPQYNSSQVIRLSPAIRIPTTTITSKKMGPQSPRVPPPLLPRPPATSVISKSMSKQLCLLPKEPLPIDQLWPIVAKTPSTTSELTAVDQTLSLASSSIATTNQTSSIVITTSELVPTVQKMSTNQSQAMMTMIANQTLPTQTKACIETLPKTTKNSDKIPFTTSTTTNDSATSSTIPILSPTKMSAKQIQLLNISGKMTPVPTINKMESSEITLIDSKNTNQSLSSEKAPTKMSAKQTQFLSISEKITPAPSINQMQSPEISLISSTNANLTSSTENENVSSIISLQLTSTTISQKTIIDQTTPPVTATATDESHLATNTTSIDKSHMDTTTTSSDATAAPVKLVSAIICKKNLPPPPQLTLPGLPKGLATKAPASLSNLKTLPPPPPLALGPRLSRPPPALKPIPSSQPTPNATTEEKLPHSQPSTPTSQSQC